MAGASPSWHPIDRTPHPSQAWEQDCDSTIADSILWVSNHGAKRASPIHIQETQTEMILQIEIPEHRINHLEIRIIPEVLCLCGEQREHVEIPGYCSFDYSEQQYQSQFMLPGWVEPRTAIAAMQEQTLTVKVDKVAVGQGSGDPSHYEVELVKGEKWLVAS